MKISKMLAASATALAVGGGALSITPAAAAPATRIHYSHPYVLYMANRNVEVMKVRPHMIKIMRGLTLSDLRWQSWNARSAEGRGYALDRNGRIPVHVTIGHPVWTPAPMGPTEFRTFKDITVHAGNGYFLYMWHQDYAEGGHWALAKHWR